jgi:hypothetical protein
MNKPTKLNEPTKPITSDKQRGIGIVELLFAIATLGTTILAGALGGPKIPKATGD